jgi:hypothetical protein
VSRRREVHVYRLQGLSGQPGFRVELDCGPSFSVERAELAALVRAATHLLEVATTETVRESVVEGAGLRGQRGGGI